MSWGAQNRSKDAKTPSGSRGRSQKPELGSCPIQPYVHAHTAWFTERSPSPTYDTHVALGLGTPTHPLAANFHSYLQH
jgi:hypothetical protein